MLKTDEKIEELRGMLGEIELDVVTSYTLADAIREGSQVSTQAHGWGEGDSMCALHAAGAAAAARGFISIER